MTPGNSTGSSSGASQTTAPVEVQKIVVGLGGVDTAFAPLFYTEAKGYFADEGIELQVEVNYNVVPLLVSNQIDVGLIGTPAAFAPVKDGKATSIIYGAVGGGGAGAIAAAPDVTSVEECKKVGTSPIGTGGYSWAVYFQKLYGVEYELVPLQDVPSAIAGVLSGQFDCVAASISQLVTVLAEEKVHLVADPTDRDNLPEGFPLGLVEVPFFMLKDTLADRRDGIVRFLRALDRGVAELRVTSADEIATALRDSNDDFKAIPQEQLAAALDTYSVFWAPNDGYVPEDIWSDELSFYIDGGTTFIDPDDAKYSYASMVDMGPYHDAIGTPGK